MHVIGTAGHVDHGKSSLVTALTGTNPDRWLEEQLRGMTLDLGFAHLEYEDGVEAGIVDVPGHERFLHNMLAGAAGMELLLLVVAADEGIRPQTREHLQIASYLDVRQVIVVATKADLLGADELAFACESIREELAGSIAANAHVYAVSTVTGAGLAELRSAIHDALQRLPARAPEAPVYLPIDRVFALPGHGTIVTGTLMQGRLRTGDTVVLRPSERTVRVRGLQSFGRRRDEVEGGARAAVNLPNVDVAEIARGEMLVAPELAAASHFNVRFTPLQQALPMLRRRTAVRAHIGSAEIAGTLVLTTIPQEARTVEGMLMLKKATVAFPGAAFILRRLSPKDLLGGGRVASCEAQAEPAAEHTPEESSILSALYAAELQPLDTAAIARAANLRQERVQLLLDALAERDDVLRVGKPAGYLHSQRAHAFLSAVLERLRKAHAAEPWAMGLTSLALARELRVAEPVLLRVLAAYAQQGRIAYRAGYFASPDHRPSLTPEQRALFDEIVPIDPAHPFLPGSLADAVLRVKQSRVPGVGKAFDTLLARGALVKVNDDLYRGTQIAQIHAKIEAYLRTEKRMTMAQFRDLVGTSRKYTVPLLEWFDARGITLRSGDYRVLRTKEPG